MQSPCRQGLRPTVASAPTLSHRGGQVLTTILQSHSQLPAATPYAAQSYATPHPTPKENTKPKKKKKKKKKKTKKKKKKKKKKKRKQKKQTAARSTRASSLPVRGLAVPPVCMPSRKLKARKLPTHHHHHGVGKWAASACWAWDRDGCCTRACCCSGSQPHTQWWFRRQQSPSPPKRPESSMAAKWAFSRPSSIRRNRRLQPTSRLHTRPPMASISSHSSHSRLLHSAVAIVAEGVVVPIVADTTPLHTRALTTVMPSRPEGSPCSSPHSHARQVLRSWVVRLVFVQNSLPVASD